MNRPRRQPGGFTLLELLVATAMTAVLAGSLYATLHVAFKARRSASGAVEQMRRVELAVELIRADVESALVPRGLLAGVFLGEDGAGGSASGTDTLAFYCTGDASQQAEGTGDIRLVEIGCELAEDSEQLVLLRRATTNLLTTSVTESDAEVLCRNVRSFELRYFDGMEWQEGWDSEMWDASLPLAVEVTLELERADGVESDRGGYWVSRIFRLPCSSVVSGMQVEMGF